MRSRSPTPTQRALKAAKLARARKVKNGVVQDKLFLPGLLKMKALRDAGFFGRMLAVRGEFGYWVIEGDWGRRAAAAELELPQGRRRRHHPRYAVPLALRARQTFGAVKAVSCLGATHIPKRVDENGKTYEADADDAAYATFELEGGVIAHINSSWCVRVRRDDLVTFQLDGVLGLRGVRG